MYVWVGIYMIYVSVIYAHVPYCKGQTQFVNEVFKAHTLALKCLEVEVVPECMHREPQKLMLDMSKQNEGRLH
jgi:hypothetical protein